MCASPQSAGRWQCSWIERSQIHHNCSDLHLFKITKAFSIHKINNRRQAKSKAFPNVTEVIKDTYHPARHISPPHYLIAQNNYGCLLKVEKLWRWRWNNAHAKLSMQTLIHVQRASAGQWMMITTTMDWQCSRLCFVCFKSGSNQAIIWEVMGSYYP